VSRGVNYTYSYWKLAAHTEVNGQVKSAKCPACRRLSVAAETNVTPETQ